MRRICRGTIPAQSFTKTTQSGLLLGRNSVAHISLPTRRRSQKSVLYRSSHTTANAPPPTAPLPITSPSPSPAREIYHPEADVEDLEDYVPGGYHPTTIGDTFRDGQYTIVHKLGFGGYSTVWLARDQRLERYVSLKILAASASTTSNEGATVLVL
ncbi:Uu.00g145630.m01.CDS01 [Anthostomella pinea]|uniref:non-specific serine/threonine protein kinase n=1 Tax=Anthostomella pinea TaxID=933095 RepID=A0AAI8VS89_9PEZI|nr:Uu.00g145630.m01.CDS01 [Anthostomella pinea]